MKRVVLINLIVAALYSIAGFSAEAARGVGHSLGVLVLFYLSSLCIALWILDRRDRHYVVFVLFMVISMFDVVSFILLVIVLAGFERDLRTDELVLLVGYAGVLVVHAWAALYGLRRVQSSALL